MRIENIHKYKYKKVTGQLSGYENSITDVVVRQVVSNYIPPQNCHIYTALHIHHGA